MKEHDFYEVGKGTSPTDLAGRAKQGSLDLRSLWEDPLGLGGNQTRSVAPLNLSEDNLG